MRTHESSTSPLSGSQTPILSRFFGPEQRGIPWLIANPLLAAAIARGHDLSTVSDEEAAQQ
jgi:hypothetical protein